MRLPATVQVLARINDVLLLAWGNVSTLVWAIAATALFGFFRLGELLVEYLRDYNAASSLSWGDVAVDSRTSPTKIHLRRSKCD